MKFLSTKNNCCQISARNRTTVSDQKFFRSQIGAVRIEAVKFSNAFKEQMFPLPIIFVRLHQETTRSLKCPVPHPPSLGIVTKNESVLVRSSESLSMLG